MDSQRIEKVLSTLENVAVKLEQLVNKGGGSIQDAEFIAPFQEIIDKDVKPFVSLSESIAPEVGKSASLLLEGFQKSLNILKIASQSKCPSSSELMTILKPVSQIMESIKKNFDENFKSKYQEHLHAVESICSAFGWFTAPMKPQREVVNSIESAQFYTNRVLKNFKEIDEKHKLWVQGLIKIFKSLEQYLETYHSAGCSWNPSGGSAVACAGASVLPTATATTSTKTSNAPASDRGALMSSLSKGLGVTSGLKKVDDSMKTHKNPNLRASSAVADKTPSQSSGSAPKYQQKPASKVVPERCLDGKKLLIGGQCQQQMLEVNEDIGISNTIQMFKCSGSNVVVPMKVNAISIQDCSKCQIQLSAGLIASCDLINCKSVTVHCMGFIPVVSIDNSDSCNVCLYPKSIETKVTTANSSTCNVTLCTDSDSTEHPIPYQFESFFKDGKLVTKEVENE